MADFLPFLAPLFADLALLAFFDFAGLAGGLAAVEFAAVEFVTGTLPLAAAVLLAFAVPALAEVPGFEAVARAVRGLADAASLAVGIAADMTLAASDSDFTAVSIALVALVMARSALVIVFAESVAWVAAVFSFAAAFVTLVAADETSRGVTVPAALAGVRVVRFAAEPVVRLAVADVVRVAVVRLAVVAAFVPLALARWRAGFAAAVSVGTELPLSRSVTEVSFHVAEWFTHSGDAPPVRYAASGPAAAPIISFAFPTMYRW